MTPSLQNHRQFQFIISELPFLSSYVEQARSLGLQNYDEQKNRNSIQHLLLREGRIGGKFSASAAISSMNLGPYEAPAKATLQQSSLYKAQAPVQGTQEIYRTKQVWTKEGHVGLQTTPTIQPTFQPSVQPTYQQSPGSQLNTQSQEQQKLFKKQAYPQVSQQELEKQKLANALFGGISTKTENPKPSIIKQNVAQSTTSSKKEEEPKPVQQVNLLDF